ncbi:MAG TPA: hypothetical protein GX519_02380 [Thermoanaerobacterales bacterium]|nr:hypothetical protein [Thermoanaerobacterales bacterium]
MIKEKVLEILKEFPGLTDRQITDKVLGLYKPQQSINQLCRNFDAVLAIIFRELFLM